MLALERIGRLGGCGFSAALLGLAVIGAPQAASADHGTIRVVAAAERVWVPPVYETRARTITVPAVFEDRTRQVWHEPVYKERRYAIELPAKAVTRQVARFSPFGRFLGYELVREIVEPARMEWRTEPVLVRAGWKETVVERVMIRPERIEMVYDQVVVAPGHWETRTRAYPRHATTPGFEVGYVGTDGGHGWQAGIRLEW